MARTIVDIPEGVSEVAGAAGGREAFGGRLLPRGQLLAQPAAAVLARLPLSSRSAHHTCIAGCRKCPSSLLQFGLYLNPSKPTIELPAACCNGESTQTVSQVSVYPETEMNISLTCTFSSELRQRNLQVLVSQGRRPARRGRLLPRHRQSREPVYL